MPSELGTILVVEDEAAIAETIVYALRSEGFKPIWKATGREALAVMTSETIALVVLDVGLPDTNGFELCRKLQIQGRVPVIFLTARDSEVDRIVGLEVGGDDYMAKPFSPRELTARVRAVLRRTKAGPGEYGKTANDAPWAHDAEKCRVSYQGHTLELTRNEYRLLAALLAQPGRVFNRDQLMNAAWDDPGAALDRTVDAHIKLLRAKLRAIVPGDDPIVTHRGLGYSLRET
ncbi:MAG: two-component system response regulator CreB [Cephaloticoccus sp.]|nr:two-component system response regulator CreB [Cephaloticoccus sp.]MCF7761577.1 two-component system response regulator CreB [Cephaloticoccus sp.]